MEKELLTRTALVLSLLCFSGTLAVGQHTYEAMLRDGRVWNCMHVYRGGVDEQQVMKYDTVRYDCRVDGKDEIDGRTCYMLSWPSITNRGDTWEVDMQNRCSNYYYEEGAKVYRHSSGGWKLLFDFSLSEGDTDPFTGLKVVSVREMNIRGKFRRCIYFPLSNYVADQIFWIEGIGSTQTGPYLFPADIQFPGSYRYSKLLSVYDGDSCIFDAKDLHATTEGIDAMGDDKGAKTNDKYVYDLQGRRVTGTPCPGIYIYEGRKRVVR